MEKIIRQGRLLFGITIIALGVEHLICARIGTVEKDIFLGHTVLPVIPWVPARPWLGYLIGLLLLAAGLSIVANVRARQAAILFGIFFLLCVLWRVTSVLAVRTGSFEMLALGGSALILAGTLPDEGGYDRSWNSILRGLIKSGRFLFAISMVVFGVDHFLFLRFVSSLVPPWIPWHLFWASFTGAAFIAAGVGIATKWMGRWGAALIGTMFLLWFLLLHAPRVLGLSTIAAAPHNPNEWSSAFIALGICGGSWICAWALSAEGSRKHSGPKPVAAAPA
jgi:uncharacterized membrane protein